MAVPDVLDAESIRRSKADTLWSRRDFFSLAGWAGVLVVLATMTLGFFRFMFPRVLFEPPTRFEAGRPQEYLVGTVDERFKIERRVWIVHEEYGLFALLAICTHLGCTPNWFPAENKFKCPCHGSGFRRDGTNFEGPAPRPLDRIKLELTPEGDLVVDKAHIFRMAAGKDPDEQYPQAILKV
ncbi:MAG: ubiquinol-cytochrome c reductase iron-sulfur subunit [Deltaproteobacteria bacterium]|nr:ubiquinol-cytochrome c reductase iron-sulfur subunit [Deltaproteobacteria bacterium]MBI3078763.1 ubiquinol-cytochrome c reductase iron-sulfur subunit [Deltaproteobacteria bacterium]